MAFGSRLRTGGFNKVALSALACAFAVGAAGDLGVLFFAKDNTSTAADGDNGEVTSVTDNVGGIWTKAVEFTNVQGGAAAGATISIWYSILAGATPTVTVNFASCTAQAWTATVCSIGAGNTVAIESTSGKADDGVDASNLQVTLAVSPSREYFIVRGTAHETATTTYTPTSGYANNSFTGTTGGSDVTNMGVVEEDRVVTTNTVEATDPTCTAADHASAMVAFYEVPKPSNWYSAHPMLVVPLISGGKGF